MTVNLDRTVILAANDNNSFYSICLRIPVELV